MTVRSTVCWKPCRDSPTRPTVKVLWTHGMCTHLPGWVDGRMQRLVDAVWRHVAEQ